MKNCKKSIYRIITSSGTGSGFTIENYDYIITNYHVVAGSKIVAVEDYQKGRHIAHVVMVNTEVDIAFLYIENFKNTSNEITISKDLEIENTDKVYTHGYPYGMPYTVTEGIVSSKKQPLDNRYLLQTDAAVNPGNSGGPMLNADGVLMAITIAKFTDADNIGFGIPYTDLIKELEDFTFIDTNYRVKCNSCDSYIEKETKFCENCGKDIDISVFEEFEKSLFAQFVEEGIAEIGMNPVLGRAGRDFWEFYQGSAFVKIFVYDKNYLIATSAINKLPKKNLNKLLTYLLQDKVAPYKLSIDQNTIFISYRVHLSDIYSSQKDKIKENIKNLPLKADELDNFFCDEFGCELSIYAKKDDEDTRHE